MVKVGDKIKSWKYPETPNGNIFTVCEVFEDAVVATCDAGSKNSNDFAWFFYNHEYELISDDLTTFGDDGTTTTLDGVIKADSTNPLQYFTMTALVEAVSKAIDAGDTQSARAIIDAMEAK